MHPGAQRRHLVVRSKDQPPLAISHRIVEKSIRTNLIHLNYFKLGAHLAK